MTTYEQYLIDNCTIFKAIRGSVAYGTNIEGSDEDIVGIYIQPDSDLTGLRYIPQISTDDGNAVFYELRRFYELAMEGNPNIMELFATPSDCLIHSGSIFGAIVGTKDIFITQNLFNSFANYARSQIKKARGFNKKMNWEMDRVKRKRVGDFCYVLKGENREDTISLSFFLRMSEIPMDDIGLAKVNNFPETYAMYRLAEGTGGIFTEKSDDVQLRSIPKDAQFLDYMRFDKNAYSTHCKHYREYVHWIEKRNNLRYTMNLEHGKGYDAKNMMHCIRLINTAIDIAQKRGVVVRRSPEEVKVLLSIRRGEMEYDDLLAMAEEKILIAEEAFEKAQLPVSVNSDIVHKLINQVRLFNQI